MARESERSPRAQLYLPLSSRFQEVVLVLGLTRALGVVGGLGIALAIIVSAMSRCAASRFKDAMNKAPDKDAMHVLFTERAVRVLY